MSEVDLLQRTYLTEVEFVHRFIVTSDKISVSPPILQTFTHIKYTELTA